MAGVYLVDLMPEQVVPILRAVGEKKDASSASFRARWTLLAWEREQKKARDEQQNLSAEGVYNYRQFDAPRIAFCGRTFQFTSAGFTVQHGLAQDPAFVPTVLIR